MRIVVLDGSTLNPGDNPWTGLEQLGQLEVFQRTSPEELLDRAADAQVLVINKVHIDAAILDQLPELRFITVSATGFDCVDGDAARARGIPVAHVPVYGTDSVAQHTFALLLHILHRIDIHDHAVRAGEWSERKDFSFWKIPLNELAGKSMGIIGFGRIGRRVGQLAHAFGMHVLANTDPPGEAPEYAGFEWASLNDLMARADVVSLHCPLTSATRGMVDRSLLGRAKPTTILINASRGPLVVDHDLADALNAGTIAAAGLDVVSTEPIEADNPLLSARNCFITPHLAWATLDARRRLMQVTVENVAGYRDGKLRNIVNGVGCS
jgi:glycerate dehydrogenase